ncbi:RNA polymerase sigma factor [Synoicihabitans lomoniglobus]|uniref:Sigma-70 family RNA polymerase sigma factor n=1 Tax=Synoicihabitans lomoniglobus TaxID=2909285 RepID=A0AAE9ZWT3_9BACT|nr:sigma-70 family RNA polymerase sigma factor [Opitutaceae bacterium LMO-M01]WED64871.1 sigma-70 family RNA polymerase sigma factor [Opitutaceae bacterium LMO-M01]
MDIVYSTPAAMSIENNQRVTNVVNDAGRRLLRFIRARVGSDADAEDVLQDVWQQLVVTLNAGPIERIGAWLYTVARHRIIDGYRKKPAMASLDAVDADDLAAFGPEFADLLLRDDHTPRAEHQRRLFWEHLHIALAELPAPQREVFVWHELEALSFQDIAELTGDNLNTLLSRKRYAIQHLRLRLAPLRADFLSHPA